MYVYLHVELPTKVNLLDTTWGTENTVAYLMRINHKKHV